MSLKLISKHRTSLMAIAMIWIGINHSDFPFKSKLFGFVLSKCGYCGVDIFVFLSGFGLYYACKKNPTYIEYIKRRFLRIYPYNIPAAIIGNFLYKQGVLASIVNILGISVFFKNDLLFWFSSFIIVMYVIFPLYYKLFIKKPFLISATFIVVIVIICLQIPTSKYHVLYQLYRVIPVLLGTLFAYINDKDIMKSTYCYLLIILMFIGWFLMYYMYHNMGNELQHVAPLAMITPGTILLFAWIIDKISIIQKPLNYIGQYSFQFYLIHEKIVMLFYMYYGVLFISGIGFDWWINIIAFVLSFVLAVIYKKLIDKIMSVIMKKTEGVN